MKSFAVQKEHKRRNQSVLKMDTSGFLSVVCSTKTTGMALHRCDATLDTVPTFAEKGSQGLELQMGTCQ